MKFEGMHMRMMELVGKSGNSKIFIGESISHLASLCTSEKNVVVTDKNVRKLHGEKFPDFPVLEVGLGEENKTLPLFRCSTRNSWISSLNAAPW